MSVKITILCDNVSGPDCHCAEYGLSILIEVDGRSFLWDSGQSSAAAYNAGRLGVDLRGIEGIGISHGHFDHCGGLGEILSLSGPKTVFLHPEALAPKYHITEKGRRFIGIPYRTEWIRGMSENLELFSGEVEVMPNVFMTGEIPRVTRFENTDPNLFCVREEELIVDPFADDQALVIKTPDGLVVVLGCAHAGLVNTLIHVTTKYGPVKAIVGGTHLMYSDPQSEMVQSAIEYLAGLKPGVMILCHCTGAEVTAEMKKHFNEAVIFGHAGLSYEF
ncbi:MAG: MBL fold metallo-hydrolase [Actinobacteria bacterium]|nr:MBL fold metallo-hydrolase [Actinomycetota bacterium]